MKENKQEKTRVGINGFGRIGRTTAKLVLQQPSKFELVVVNDINPCLKNMSYLFKYDSTYGKFDGSVSIEDDMFIINNQRIRYFSEREMTRIPWQDFGVDIVIDSSGVDDNIFSARELIERDYLKKVIITKCSEHVDREIIMGVNDSKLQQEDHVVSNSICDANAVAHIVNWIEERYQIETGSVTTLHPWLSYQNLVDGTVMSQSHPGVVWNDFALGRASVDSLIPKNTTTVKAIERVLPGIKDKLLAFSYRIPTDIVVSADITLKTSEIPTLEELTDFINDRVSQSAYIRTNEESLVSLDYEKENMSAVIDMQWLQVHNGLMKFVLWYDNEWGYSCRILDLAEAMMNF